MSKKLTLKEKAMEGFLLAQRLKHYASELQYMAEDYGWSDAKRLSKQMAEYAKEKIELFR